MTENKWEEKYIDDTLNVAYDFLFHNGKGKNMKSVYNDYFENIPKYIYRFQKSSADYVYEDLANNELAFVKIELFNDPFDSLLSTGFSLSDSVKFKEDKDRFIKNINDFREKMYVCCFSSNLNSIPMWSYYGENHKGICIEYKMKKLNQLYERNVLPILYLEGRKKLIESIGDYKVIDQVSLAKMLYIKNKQWEHENEWRLVVKPDKDNGDNIFKAYKNDIESIYLGCKMDEDKRKMFINLCSDKRIKCYQMKMDSESFKLTYEQAKI